MGGNGIHVEPDKFLNAENKIKSIKNNGYKEKVLNYPSDFEYSSDAESCALSINNLFLSIEKLSENIAKSKNALMSISIEFADYVMTHQFNNGLASDSIIISIEDEDLIINYLKTILGVNDYVLGEYNIKSLFDLYFTNNDDNFAYEGYGVDQGTLNLLFFCRNNEDDQEKRDYLIAKYMQKYNMSYEDAYHFLSSIDYETRGVCSYASFCNEVYTSYIGKEEQFKQDFGFDMYRIDKYGNKVLNSEEFLADVILYANLDTNGGKYYYEKDGSIKINKITNEDQARLQLCDPKIMDVEFPRNTDVINNYLKSHNENLGYNSNVVSTKNPKKLKNIIKEGQANNKKYTLGYYDNPNKENEIIMYDSNGYATSIDQFNGGGHSVYITDANDEGLVVSSWGKSYTIEWEDLENSKKQFGIVESEIERR